MIHAGWLVVAFLLGVFVTFKVEVVKNARQIRRNGEALRRRLDQQTEQLRGTEWRP